MRVVFDTNIYVSALVLPRLPKWSHRANDYEFSPMIPTTVFSNVLKPVAQTAS